YCLFPNNIPLQRPNVVAASSVPTGQKETANRRSCAYSVPEAIPMKALTTFGTAVLFLSLGAIVPAFAQQKQEEAKPEQQHAQPQHQQKQQQPQQHAQQQNQNKQQQQQQQQHAQQQDKQKQQQQQHAQQQN